jgi:GNAT superfamily N-acetyltransferase
MLLATRLEQRCPGLRLRPEADSDTPFLCELYASVRADEVAPLPWPDELKHKFLSEQFFLQRKHYREHYVAAEFLVIEQAQRRIGRVYLHRSEVEVRLMEISLIRELRGHGNGGRLLRALLQECDADGLPVTLHVEPPNPARRLYERLGFVAVEHGPVYQQMRREAWPA